MRICYICYNDVRASQRARGNLFYSIFGTNVATHGQQGLANITNIVKQEYLIRSSTADQVNQMAL